MAFGHGKTGVFKLDNSAGTLVDLSTYCDNVSMPRSVETGETTTFNVAGGSKTYVTGLNEATISLSGKWDPTLDAHVEGVRSALNALTLATATFEYGPIGSTAAMIKYSGESLLTSYEVSTPVADVVTWSAELQVTGIITRGTWP